MRPATAGFVNASAAFTGDSRRFRDSGRFGETVNNCAGPEHALWSRGARGFRETFAAQRLVSGNRELAEELTDRAEVLAVSAGQTLISQGADDTEIYFILAGTFDVVVNGRRVAGRGPGDHVGEMAAVQPAQRRSATVTALEDAIVAKLSTEAFSTLGSRHPQVYRLIAQELARRVLQLESRSIE